MAGSLWRMRSVDNLARLYASSGRPLRKLLLSEVLALPGADPGAPELFSILHHEAETGPTVLRRHARWTLGEVLRGFVAESHGIANDAMGPLPMPLLEPFERPARRLAEIYLSGESLQRMLASLAIGQMPARSAIDRLWKSLEEKGASFAALAALTESGDPDSVDPVAELITENAVSQPDLLLLLSRLPFNATMNVVQPLWDKLDAYGQGHIAWALGAHALGGVREFARAALGSNHPFIVVNALISASRWADATQVDQIANAALRVDHAWVRRSAVRVLAGFPATPATTAVALHWLAKGDRFAQIEALSMLAPRSGEAAVAAGVKAALASTDDEVRAAAMAALPAAERSDDKVMGLMLSPHTDVRRTALSMLAQASRERAVEVLANAANEDASKRVRRWAASDLARVGGEGAAKALLDLSNSQHAEVREAAVLALPRVRDVAPADLLALITASGDPLPPRLLTALGTLAGQDARLGVPDALTAAVSGHDARAVSTALRALRPIADRVDRRQLFPLLAHEDEAIRRRTASLLALAGEAGALWGMIERADAKSDESGHVLRALMEAGALLGANWRLRQAALAVAAPQLSPKKVLENPKSRRDEHLSTARVIAAKFKDLQKKEVPAIAAEIAEASHGHVLVAQNLGSADNLDLDRRTTTDEGRGPVAASATALPTRKKPPKGLPRPALPGPALAAVGVLILFAMVLWMRPAAVPEAPVNVGVGKIVPGPKDLPANEMAVEHVDGFVTVGDTPAHAEPLRKRGKLVLGETLESDATGSATLVDRAGNRVQLGPKSRVGVLAEAAGASAGARPRLHLAEPEGDVTLDMRAAGDVPVTVAGKTVTLSRAVVRVAGVGPDRTVYVKGGDATYFDSAGSVLRARGGWSIALDSSGKGTLSKDVVDSRPR